ncbi:hypothetical protein AB0912_28665 [Streptomyces sp. NPDC007084]|uniref:hypothetical protein n=1 Tax=Streptomyces sp. NPDC007084 TaxID=3154313 RepID=UPI00345626BE
MSLALEDGPLGAVLTSPRASARPATEATAGLWTERLTPLLERTVRTDWSVREHRFRVLAAFLAGTRVADLWHAREPRSGDAALLRAAVVVHLARQHGTRPPAEAIDWCGQACAAAPEDPTPWAVLMDVYRRLSYGQEDVLAAWSEAIIRDRWHRGAYLSMLQYLSPAEAGSTMKMVEFVDRVAENAPPDAACASVQLRLHVHRFHALRAEGGLHAATAGRYWSEREAAGHLDSIERAWPQPGFLRHAQRLEDLNLLAYALDAAERREEAAVVFRAIDKRVTLWPWGSTETEALSAFTAAGERCAGRARGRRP